MGLGPRGAKWDGGIAFVRQSQYNILQDTTCKMQDAKCRGRGVSTSEARARSGSPIVRQVPNVFHLDRGDDVKIRLLIDPDHRHLDLFCSHSSPFEEASPKACVMPPWIVGTNDDGTRAREQRPPSPLGHPNPKLHVRVVSSPTHELRAILSCLLFCQPVQRADRGLVVEYRAGHARASEPGIPEGRDLPKSSTEGSPPAPFLEGWEGARYCSASTPAARTRPVLLRRREAGR